MLGLRIAVVDNDEVFLYLIDEYFKIIKEENFTAKPIMLNSAPKLLEKLSEGYEPHIIMLDLNMPGMSGFDFLNEYKERGYHIKYISTKIYIITSSINERDKEISKEFKIISKYITKTPDNSMLNLILQDYKQYEYSNLY